MRNFLNEFSFFNAKDGVIIKIKEKGIQRRKDQKINAAHGLFILSRGGGVVINRDMLLSVHI